MALPRYLIKSAYFNPDGSNKQLFFSKIGNTPTINIQEQNRLMNPVPNIEKDFTPSYNPQEAVKLQLQRIVQLQELERQQALKDLYWLRTANLAGVGRTFNNLDEVKAFLQEIGLTGNQVDGKIGTTTLGLYSKWLAKLQPIAESLNVSQLPELTFTHGEWYNPNTSPSLPSNTLKYDYGKYVTGNNYRTINQARNAYLRGYTVDTHKTPVFNREDFDNWFDYNYSPRTITGMSGQEQRVRGWTRKQEQGGIMEYFNNDKQINKFASGGKTNAKNVLTAVIQGLLSNDPEKMLLQLLRVKTQPGGELQYNSIKEAVRELAKTDKSAAQAIQVWEEYENQVQMAEKGAKLEFMKQLKGICPEGTEKVYLQNGGCMCKKAKMEKGDKMENKKEFFDAKKEKCGGKMKKHQEGGQIIKAADGVSLLSRLLQLFKRKLPTAEPASERYAGGYILDNTPNFIYIQGSRSLNDVDYPPTISRQIVDGDTIYTEKARSSSPYVSGVRTTNNDSNRAGYERAQRRFNLAYSTLGGNPYE